MSTQNYTSIHSEKRKHFGLSGEGAMSALAPGQRSMPKPAVAAY